jgi:hypothetical protein
LPCNKITGFNTNIQKKGTVTLPEKESGGFDPKKRAVSGKKWGWFRSWNDASGKGIHARALETGCGTALRMISNSRKNDKF